MSPYQYSDDDSDSSGTILGVVAGALAGFALGMFVTQRMGGISGIAERLRRQGIGQGTALQAADDFEELDEYGEDELEEDEGESDLELRVLEAFRNDPVLCARAVDIGSIGEGIVELAGWVDTEEETAHAVTIARGVPGVETVVNRLAVGADEGRLEDAARRFAEDDGASTGGQWEGNTVGTGRRRQGTSDEPDRHADPKVELEERWSGTEQALREAADDTDGRAARAASRARRAGVRGDRTGGSPVAPTGVPKADHVANPMDATDQVEPPGSRF